MNRRINQLAQSLLRKASLEDCTLDEVRAFADRHPYFGAAQLLLTKKLQLEQSPDYDAQLQKTFLYFHNPLWVEQLLNEGGQAVLQGAPATETFNSVAADLHPVMQSPTGPAEEPVAVPVVVTEPVAETPAPVEELAFEPYHTVDYFASQGIRLREEEKTNDKFGKQLRSFTDWLKTMKRLPAAEISRQVAPQAEKQVEQLAEHSLDSRDVVTEAMAEVWEKQGNTEKALEIYAKLSLLEPSKSPYFAAKIDALKKLR